MDAVILVAKYATIGGVIALLFFPQRVYSYISELSQTASRPLPPSPTAQRPAPTKRKSKAPTKPASSSLSSSSVSAAASTSALTTPTREPLTSAVTTSAEPEKPANDAAFAREFALAQRGTNLAKKQDQKSKKSRTKKQNKVEETTTDDQDTSSQSSHTPKPLEAVTTHAASGVPAASAPVTAVSHTSNGIDMETDYGTHTSDALRIIPKEILAPVPREEEWTSVPTKSQKVQKKVEKAEESKKQRQRQAQKDQNRQLREEADRKQRALMEAQRRTARIARGEPAKNGEAAYTPSSAPSKSAWVQSTESADMAANGSNLLDTVDEPASRVAGPIIANGEETTNGDVEPNTVLW